MVYYGQVLILAAVLLLDACSRASGELPLTPPASPPLSRSVIGYGVINSSFTQVQNEPAPGSVSLGYLRRGSVVEILERKMMSLRGVSESWIRVQSSYRGWIREEGVQIYTSKAQAMTASELLSRSPEVR
ncbi:hypothetical protein FACS1894137_02640 [Spirochaetia bacterium]|nr:hypothetical protein FACS1894137_02640 [Spirochaetia bacterium]